MSDGSSSCPTTRDVEMNWKQQFQAPFGGASVGCHTFDCNLKLWNEIPPSWEMSLDLISIGWLRSLKEEPPWRQSKTWDSVSVHRMHYKLQLLVFFVLHEIGHLMKPQKVTPCVTDGGGFRIKVCCLSTRVENCTGHVWALRYLVCRKPSHLCVVVSRWLAGQEEPKCGGPAKLCLILCRQWILKSGIGCGFVKFRNLIGGFLISL